MESYLWSVLTDICFLFFQNHAIEVLVKHAIDFVALDLQLFQAFLAHIYNYIIDIYETLNAADDTTPPPAAPVSELGIYDLQAQVPSPTPTPLTATPANSIPLRYFIS